MKPQLNVRQMTVNEVVANWPESLPVFNHYGIDSCCGGPLVVETAAARHGIDLAELEAALRASAPAPPRPDPAQRA